MADVTIVKRNNYSGLDADKPAIANVNDTYLATDTEIKYFWNGNVWVNVGPLQFVPRSVAAFDFLVGAFVTDGTIKVDGLDLSAIVPAGAVTVKLRVVISDGVVDSNFFLRQSAVDTTNIIDLTTLLVNVPNSQVQDINIDSDRKLDYFGDNLAFTLLSVAVLGWWI